MLRELAELVSEATQRRVTGGRAAGAALQVVQLQVPADQPARPVHLTNVSSRFFAFKLWASSFTHTAEGHDRKAQLPFILQSRLYYSGLC